MSSSLHLRRGPSDGPLSLDGTGVDGLRLPLADLKRRAWALMIDLACFVVIWVAVFFVGIGLWGALEPVLNTDNSSTYMLGAINVALPALSSLAALAWGGVFTGLRGRTPGKIALKLKVVRADDHSLTIGFWRGMIRETRFILCSPYVLVIALFLVIPALVIVVLYLFDHLSAMFGKKVLKDSNQTWHDSIARSHVVYTG